MVCYFKHDLGKKSGVKLCQVLVWTYCLVCDDGNHHVKYEAS